jgi:hypothetical protein
MPDPVAWTEIEPGWQVVDVDGHDVGRVSELRGDTDLDIFDGLTVTKGILSRDKYVPAEQVAGIVVGEVRVAISREQIEALANQ